LQSSRVVKRRPFRDVFIDERHGPDRDVIPDTQGVRDDATVGPHADIVTNDQVVRVEPKGLDANGRVLPDEKILTDFDAAGDDHAREVADSKARPYLGVDTDIDSVLEVELSFQALGIAARNTVSGVKVLGQSVHEQIPECVVFSGSLENVADKAYAAATLFLVRDFGPPMQYQGVEIQSVAPVKPYSGEKRRIVAGALYAGYEAQINPRFWWLCPFDGMLMHNGLA
jgi:hypothetical protein